MALDGPHAFDRRQDDREEAAEEDDDGLHVPVEPEPQDDQRDERNARQRIEEVQPRVEREREAPVPADEDPERDREDDGRARAHDELERRDPHVVPEARLRHLARAGRRDRRRRAEEELVDETSGRADLPDDEEQDDSRDAQDDALVPPVPPHERGPRLADPWVDRPERRARRDGHSISAPRRRRPRARLDAQSPRAR